MADEKDPKNETTTPPANENADTKDTPKKTPTKRATKKAKADDVEVYVVARGRTVHTDEGPLSAGQEFAGSSEDIDRLVKTGFILKKADIATQIEPTPGVTRA